MTVQLSSGAIEASCKYFNDTGGSVNTAIELIVQILGAYCCRWDGCGES